MSEAANTHGIRLLDSTLRDGSHGIRHRYTPQQVELIAGELDQRRRALDRRRAR